MTEVVQQKTWWNKVTESLTIDKIGQGILWLGIGVAGAVLVEKIVNISEKIAPTYERYIKPLNRNAFFETIDTIGDNIQLVDAILKALKVEGFDLSKVADFLQNTATASKYIYQLIDTIKSRVHLPSMSYGSSNYQTGSQI